MADDEEGSEKPFEATPRKLEEARKRGEVPVSQDLVTFGVYAAIVAMAAGAGGWSLSHAGISLTPFLSDPEALTAGGGDVPARRSLAGPVAGFVVAISGWLALPYLCALTTAGLQGALIFAPEKLKPKLNRISPIKNAKQKYGADGLFAFAKSAVKLVVYGTVLAVVFRAYLDEVLAMPSLPAPAILALTFQLCLRFLAVASIAILAIAVIDYVWQRAQFLRRQRMSLKEMRDEAKETEGDPHTKQARRQMGYDIATNRMLADVPGADVVVVNPEHYAVALTWSRTSGSAPACVAKGIDQVAARIRDRAIEHGVPIYSDPPTARALYATVDLGEEIPVEQYQAIAAAIRFADTMRARAGRS